MNREDLMQAFPTKRIKPVDGMAVTAEVWEEAHEYHRLRQRFHALLNHGPGIVIGLEVIASDPPDSSVYVLPGIAVDTVGQTIVLPEPMAYDLGQTQGLLHLLLTYGEGQPRAEGDGGGTPHVHAEFGIAAALTMPGTPCVELGRVRRSSREAPIWDAQHAAHPGLDEIDLRYRQEIGVAPQEAVSVAVSYLGEGPDTRHGQGARYLARALRRSGLHVWVDEGVPLTSGLELYALVYLIGRGAFQMDKEEMNGLYAYLQGGGTVFIESCRQDASGDGSPPADASFADLLAYLGVKLQEVPPDHPLLVEPSLFASLPPGFETEGSPSVQEGDGVIWSTCDYGCLWQGERRGRAASREEIRTAMEYGGNIVAYAAGRRQAAGGG